MSKVRIMRAPKDSSDKRVKWLVQARGSFHKDACYSLLDAIRFYLWHKGMPAKYVFKQSKKK